MEKEQYFCDFISAKDAKKLTEETIGEKDITQMNEIMSLVKKATQEGNYNIWFYRNLTKRNHDMLVKEGYKIKNEISYRNADNYVVISWA